MANELTEIRILKNVPLDTTYRNTVNFASTTAQTSYFLGKSKYSLDAQMYQRVQRGFTRVEKNADDLYDCNYLMFKNSHFGNKWFYCFITGVEYVNNAVSDVFFEVDVLQTWLFDWNFKQTYVSRATPNSDTYGSNVLPEPVNFPDQAYQKTELTSITPSLPEAIAYVFGTTKSRGEGGTQTATLVGNCPSATFYYAYDNFADFASNLKDAVDKVDGNVQFAFAIPKWVFDRIPRRTDGSFDTFASTVSKQLTVPKDTLRQNYNGTSWNKCLAYPYQALCVSTPMGYMEFDPSGFTDDAVFTVTFEVSPTPRYAIECNYMDRSVYIEGGTYPTIPFSNSQYPQYQQQLSNMQGALLSKALGMSSNTAQNAYMGMTANTSSMNSKQLETLNRQQGAQSLSMGISAIQTVADYGQNTRQLDEGLVRSAPTMHGSASPFLGMLTGRIQPIFYLKHLRKEYAQSLNSFFTVNGYSKNQLVTPVRTSMKNYKYLQTVNCDITGSVPANDMKLICSIHDKGVTYWNSPESIGVY